MAINTLTQNFPLFKATVRSGRYPESNPCLWVCLFTFSWSGLSVTNHFILFICYSSQKKTSSYKRTWRWWWRDWAYVSDLFVFPASWCKRPSKKTLTLLCASAGEEHRVVPSCFGGAAQTNPLLNHLHDLSAQAPKVLAPTLRQAQRDLRGHGSRREQGKALLCCEGIRKSVHGQSFFSKVTIWKIEQYKGMHGDLYGNSCLINIDVKG